MKLGRLLLVALLLLALVVATTITSAVLLLRSASPLEPPRNVATMLGAAHVRHAVDIRSLLQFVCSRDLHLERLARELELGGVVDEGASRMATSLSRQLGGAVSLLVEREGALEPLDEGGRMLSTELLSRAAQAPIALDHARGVLTVQSCARESARMRLWVARSEPLASTVAQFADGSYEVVTNGASSAPRPDAALALRVPRLLGEDAGVWIHARGIPWFPLGLWPLALLASALAAWLVYALIRRPQPDEQVLGELERAAERVAMGDLTSRLGRGPGGRADRTFHTFDRMTEELADMRTRLADAERATAWQDIARRIAHEIKNPLSPIQLAMETLRKAHAKRLPEFDEIFDESTRAILDEVRRLEHIVREFSEFARLPKPRPGALDLAALLDDTLALYRRDDIELTRSGERALPVRVDREQITQVIVNLLQNAYDAVRGSTRPRVAVQLERATQYALLHVDDIGSGVADADRSRIFEPYFTTKAHGSGLGLSIARRIAIEHGGTLSVTSGPLGGARFTLRLPLETTTSA
jgi:signal transduction histidine kinase